MKRTRYNEAEIISVLREAEAAVKKQEFCRKYGSNWQGVIFPPVACVDQPVLSALTTALGHRET